MLWEISAMKWEQDMQKQIDDLQAENARLRKERDLFESDFKNAKACWNAACEDISKAEQRAERAELLVRLMQSHVDLYPEFDLIQVYVSGVVDDLEEWPCSFTNGIPDLTEEQWERLAQLEKGTP